MVASRVVPRGYESGARLVDFRVRFHFLSDLLLQKCYEHKQYKNGLKFAKQILSNPKFSEHGGEENCLRLVDSMNLFTCTSSLQVRVVDFCIIRC